MNDSSWDFVDVTISTAGTYLLIVNTSDSGQKNYGWVVLTASKTNIVSPTSSQSLTASSQIDTTNYVVLSNVNWGNLNGINNGAYGYCCATAVAAYSGASTIRVYMVANNSTNFTYMISTLRIG